MTDARIELARKRVEDLKGYYIHLTIYLLVNLGLFVIDAVQGDGWWFYWVTLGWGIGVIAHTVAMWFDNTRYMKNWEQRKLDQYVQELPHEEVDDPHLSRHLIS